jgi:T5SS/PEP-CTERM-associated repeat protein
MTVQNHCSKSKQKVNKMKVKEENIHPEVVSRAEWFAPRRPILLAALIIALISSAHQTWGYTNPIENQHTEIVTNIWNLLPDSLYVGRDTSRNSMIVTNNGFVKSFGGGIGFYRNASGNKVIVGGAGSVWSNSYVIYVGNEGRSNALFITTGGRVVSGGDGYIGSETNSFGNVVTVNGAGSVWVCSTNLYVGARGSGNALSITGSGRVEFRSGYIGTWHRENVSDAVARREASSNTVTVSGAGSVWSNSYMLVVGATGRGNVLSITDGGRVLDAEGTVGYQDTSSGSRVTVSGTNSIWSNSSFLIVGKRGAGNALSIVNGGLVQTVDGTIGSEGSGSNNTVTVNGAGSCWSNSGALHIGFSGDRTSNSLTVTAGGKVKALSCTVYSGNTVQLQSAGTLEASLDLTIQADTTLEMGINGNAGLNHGHLTEGGAATLDGTLKVVFLDGFTPGPGDTFDLFDWNNVHGGFAATNLPNLSFGLRWNTGNLYTTGELRVGYSTADTDGDGMADGWEREHLNGDALPSDDFDLDSQSNLEEYIAGTHPNDEGSCFRIMNAVPDAAGFVVTWEPSASNRYYRVSWAPQPGSGLTNLVSGIEFPQNSYTDTLHCAENSGFYKVDVRMK